MATTFTELASITRLLAGSHRLDRALSASDVPAAAKKSLLVELVGAAISEASVGIAVDAIESGRGSSAAESVLGAAIDVVLSDNTDAFAASLSVAARTIGENQQLRMALTNRSTSDEAKAQLLADIFGGRIQIDAIDLLRTFVFVEHGHHIQQRAVEVAEIAAQRAGRVIAEIRTAVEVDEVRRESLVRAIETSTGKKIQPQFKVDPTIVGSVVVRVGDEVIDGSIRHRIAEARRAFAGA